MAKKNDPDDARNYTMGDMKRDMEELDDVSRRAYNPSKDDVLDEQFIGDDKDKADKVRDRVADEARRRGINKSAQTVKVRGGYKVIVYTPKRKGK